MTNMPTTMPRPRLDNGRAGSSWRRSGGPFAISSWPGSGTAAWRSKRGVAAVDHKAVGGVIGRSLAHQIHRNAAEIAGLAEAPHRNAGHHVGDELVIGHEGGGHVALDPAGQDGIGGDAVSRELHRK